MPPAVILPINYQIGFNAPAEMVINAHPMFGTGDFPVTVGWDDGNFTQSRSQRCITHVFALPGRYHVKMFGIFTNQLTRAGARGDDGEPSHGPLIAEAMVDVHPEPPAFAAVRNLTATADTTDVRFARGSA